MNTTHLLSKNARSMKPSGMTEFFDLPPDVISLGLGEPGFPTPGPIGAGGIEAILGGNTAYAHSMGVPELRQAVSAYLRERFGFDYGAEDVLITMGASLGLDCIVRTFVDPGDRVLIPKPAYGYYAALTGLSGGEAHFLPTCPERGWQLSPEVLRSAVTEKTKLLILNYPGNPTGAVMTPSALEALAEVIRDTDILVVADEIYAENVFGESHASILHCEGMRKRTLLVSGFSKSMAMTGWRIGFVCGPPELLGPVAAVNSAVTLCASTVAQAAALRGLEGGRCRIDAMNAEYLRRRDYAIERAASLGWSFVPPGGAFYLWANITSTGMDSPSFARALIREARVALMPGTVFGPEYTDYVRLTYSYPMETLTEAFNRINSFLNSR